MDGFRTVSFAENITLKEPVDRLSEYVPVLLLVPRTQLRRRHRPLVALWVGRLAVKDILDVGHRRPARAGLERQGRVCLGEDVSG